MPNVDQCTHVDHVDIVVDNAWLLICDAQERTNIKLHGWPVHIFVGSMIYLRILHFQIPITLQWRHNEYDGVSNYRSADFFNWTVCSGADHRKNIKVPRHWPLCGEFTDDRWIPRTKGQRKMFPFDDVIMNQFLCISLSCYLLIVKWHFRTICTCLW